MAISSGCVLITYQAFHVDAFLAEQSLDANLVSFDSSSMKLSVECSDPNYLLLSPYKIRIKGSAVGSVTKNMDFDLILMEECNAAVLSDPPLNPSTVPVIYVYGPSFKVNTGITTSSLPKCGLIT